MSVSVEHNPLVTVLLPVYNVEKTIYATLNSILNQSYKNIRVKIVDNCSTDNTVQILHSFQDSRVEIFKNEKNLGYETMNQNLALAEGDFVALFHGDDLYFPEIIAAEVDFLRENPDVGAVFTGAEFIDENNKILGTHDLRFIHTLTMKFDLYALFSLILGYHNFLICPSTMMRVNILKNYIKRYEFEKFGSSSDLAVALKIAENYKVGVIKKPCMQYRISQQQDSYKVDYTRIEKAAFLKVLQYYLVNPAIQGRLTIKDNRNFRSLYYADLAKRVVNSILQANFSKKKEFLKEMDNFELLRLSMHSKRALKAFIILNFSKFIKNSVQYGFIKKMLLSIIGHRRKY